MGCEQKHIVAYLMSHLLVCLTSFVIVYESVLSMWPCSGARIYFEAHLDPSNETSIAAFALMLV